MSRFLDDDAHITTIENYQPRIEEAKKNIVRAGASDKITLLEGDALEILPEMTESYDMVFMDAAKGQYGNFSRRLYGCLLQRGYCSATTCFRTEMSLRADLQLPEETERYIQG